jgi:Trk K+ transport system NAD-binding subunit/Kef-type K+ transport system membrane component KefB
VEEYIYPISYISSFAILALASKQIGNFFRQINMPLITGFLFTGILIGPFVLKLIPAEASGSLRFIDEIALAVIAFAAGNELFIKDIQNRLKSIAWVTVGLVVSTFTLITFAILILADYIPFMQSLPMVSKISIAIMGGSILGAISPSSAIAIVNELRAKGPFTKTALGVTMIMDVAVILVFGLTSSISDALLSGLSFSLGFIGLMLFELFISILIGTLLYKIIQKILSFQIDRMIKTSLILLFGFSIYKFSAFVRTYSHENWSFELFLEPLIICMIAGFLITNFSNHKNEFSNILHDVSPVIYVLFFTLTGAFLSLDVLVSIWPIAVALFLVRLVGIFIGSYTGGRISGDLPLHNRLSWMAYVTQAGVGLGLAKEIAKEFPVWGDNLAVILISVIVLNQVVGPPLFKWVINRVGESRLRANKTDFDGVRDVIIFGLRAQSVSLARQLSTHNWDVKIICTDEEAEIESVAPDIDTHIIKEITLEAVTELGGANADAMVSFMPNQPSYDICEMFYENFGTETMVVRLKDRIDFERFNKLGVLVVEPQTAVVSLLEHFVRSPVGTSLLLGMGDGQDMTDIVVRDPSMQGVTLRDLNLPLDVLILSVLRDGQKLIPRGFMRFMKDDKLTVVGPQEKLDEVRLKFDI